jgi:hypothetical protein
MINEGMMFLASYGYYGGAIGNTLNRLEQMGFFAYVLPFLLLFTLVFGILSSIKLFRDNKGVDAIIALVVALMALQLDMVPVFFAQVFPRMGVALAAILVILILAGFFIDPKKAGIMYGLLGIGVIAAIAVLVSASGNTGFYNSYWFYEYGPMVLLGVFVVVIILIVVGLMKTKPAETATEYTLGPWRAKD